MVGQTYKVFLGTFYFLPKSFGTAWDHIVLQLLYWRYGICARESYQTKTFLRRTLLKIKEYDFFRLKELENERKIEEIGLKI